MSSPSNHQTRQYSWQRPPQLKYARPPTKTTSKSGTGPSFKVFAKLWEKTQETPWIWNSTVNVFPRQYIIHLETSFCHLDAQAVADLKQHYKREIKPNKQLQQFGTRLDREQDNLGVGGVIISNDDKFNRYLIEIYNSGMFSTETITQWTKTPVANQTTPTHAHSLRGSYAR